MPRVSRFLGERGASGRVTLILTGGLRVPIDFAKALALGADGVAVSNSAMQAVGCVAARMCNSNNCPAGIATKNLSCGLDSTLRPQANGWPPSLEHRPN